MRDRIAPREAAAEAYFTASSWVLMRRAFFRHRLAVVGGTILLVIVLAAMFAGFLAPHEIFERHPDYLVTGPTRVRVFHEGRPRLPFVYGLQYSRDPVTLARIYVADESQVYPIRYFVRGDRYRFWGLFETDLHLFGVDEPGQLFLFGTDALGRDMFSRVLHGARVSLSIRLLGVAISFVLGCLLGGISGYFAGPADMLIQRIIEFLGALPSLPPWLMIPAIWVIVTVLVFNFVGDGLRDAADPYK